MVQSRISVIIPVYNTREYIRTCVESVISQTLREIEIILVDDGSDDGTGEICELLSKNDGRIKVIHQPHCGQAEARKSGIKQASAKYVCFLDSDDWVEKTYYNTLLEIVTIHNVDMVLCDHYIDNNLGSYYFHNCVQDGFYDRDRIQKEVFPKIISDGSFYRWNIYPSLCNRLLKKDLLMEIQEKVDTSLIMGEDAAISIPYIAESKSMMVVKAAYYHYYQRINSTLRKIQCENDRIQYKKLYEWLQRRLSKHIADDILEKQLKDYILFISGPRVMRLKNKYNNCMYLFPFDEVCKASKVIIYGAGIFGINMYKFLEETNFCRLVAIIDKNYLQYRIEGIDVTGPNILKTFSNDHFDFIIITVMDENAQNEIEKDIEQKGIDKKKIRKINMNSFRKWIDDEVLDLTEKAQKE